MPWILMWVRKPCLSSLSLSHRQWNKTNLKTPHLEVLLESLHFNLERIYYCLRCLVFNHEDLLKQNNVQKQLNPL